VGDVDRRRDAFELYPVDRASEAHELFLDWWMTAYFYSEESRSFAGLGDVELGAVVEAGGQASHDLKAVMAGRVAAEVLRLRREMSDLTPQQLSLREESLRRSARANGGRMSPGVHVECEVAFELLRATGHEMTDADYDAEEVALAAMGLGSEDHDSGAEPVVELGPAGSIDGRAGGGGV
jgi:hypothetical protein